MRVIVVDDTALFRKLIADVISKDEIEKFCSPEFFTKHVDDIFERVFKD